MYTSISIFHDRGEKYLQTLNYKSYEIYLYRFMDLLEYVVYFYDFASNSKSIIVLFL